LFSACLCLCTLGYTFTGTPLRNLPPFFALPIWVASWTFFLPPWLQGSRGHLARGRQCTHGKVFSAVFHSWFFDLYRHASPPSHHPDSLCEFLPSPESDPGKCSLWRNTCSPYSRNLQEMAQVSARKLFHDCKKLSLVDGVDAPPDAQLLT
jgi:hypothetical protein